MKAAIYLLFIVVSINMRNAAIIVCVNLICLEAIE